MLRTPLGLDFTLGEAARRGLRVRYERQTQHRVCPTCFPSCSEMCRHRAAALDSAGCAGAQPWPGVTRRHYPGRPSARSRVRVCLCVPDNSRSSGRTGLLEKRPTNEVTALDQLAGPCDSWTAKSGDGEPGQACARRPARRWMVISMGPIALRAHDD